MSFWKKSKAEQVVAAVYDEARIPRGTLRIKCQWDPLHEQWYVRVEVRGTSSSLKNYGKESWVSWQWWALGQKWAGKLPESCAYENTLEQAQQVGCEMLAAVKAFVPEGPGTIIINEGDCK